jgi:hypothetical protein
MQSPDTCRYHSTFCQHLKLANLPDLSHFGNSKDQNGTRQGNDAMSIHFGHRKDEMDMNAQRWVDNALTTQLSAFGMNPSRHFTGHKALLSVQLGFHVWTLYVGFESHGPF